MANPDVVKQIAERTAKLRKILAKHKAGKKLSDAELKFIEGEEEGKRAGATFDSIAQAAQVLSKKLDCKVSARILRMAKKDGAPGFRGSRVYEAELVPWLVPWLKAKEEILDGEGRDKESLECRRLRAQCEKIEHQNAVEQGHYYPRSEVEMWLVSVEQKIKDILTLKLKNEIPGKIEGLRAAEISKRMDPLIGDICKLLRKPKASRAG